MASIDKRPNGRWRVGAVQRLGRDPIGGQVLLAQAGVREELVHLGAGELAHRVHGAVVQSEDFGFGRERIAGASPTGFVVALKHGSRAPPAHG